MLLRLCLGIGGLVVLCGLSYHLRQQRRVSGGIVLAAAMLTLQAIVDPPSEQAIAQQVETQDEEEVEDGDPMPLRRQIRRHAQRIRSGQNATILALQLPADQLSRQPMKPEGKDQC